MWIFRYVIDAFKVHMSFTSVSGHLMTNDYTEQYRGWNSCDPIQLFEAPIIKYVPEVILVLILVIYRLTENGEN
jgi:DNA topoisomerase-3